MSLLYPFSPVCSEYSTIRGSQGRHFKWIASYGIDSDYGFRHLNQSTIGGLFCQASFFCFVRSPSIARGLSISTKPSHLDVLLSIFPVMPHVLDIIIVLEHVQHLLQNPHRIHPSQNPSKSARFYWVFQGSKTF